MEKRHPVLTSLVLLFTLLFVISTTGGIASASPSDLSAALSFEGAEYRPDELIVTFSRNATAADRANVRALAALEKIKDLPLANKELVRIKDGRTVADAIARLQANPRVAAVQPNFVYQADEVIPDDTRFSELWGLHNIGQTINGYVGFADCDIDAPAAWSTTMGDPDVIVAVIDEGIDITHPDLAANIWTNPGEISGNGVDDDNNGYIDDVHGWNFYGDNNIVYSSRDGDDHGTHCAGTIAAVGNNGIGVIGVAPNVKVMPLKFLGRRGGSTADAIEALGYAKLMKADLASNSWGGGAYDPSLVEAIRSFAKPFVAAAGNSGEDTDESPHYPSAYDLDNIISVAAVNNRALLSSFSNYGATSVDIGAPGESILSTLPVALGSYGSYSGTSMATPHVSGIVALMLSLDSTLTGPEVRQLLINTVFDLSSLTGKCVSGGMANAADVLAAIGSVTPPPSPTPTPTPPPTEDTTAPSLTVVTPKNGSKNVALSTQVLFDFNEPIIIAIETPIIVKAGKTDVTSQFSFSINASDDSILAITGELKNATTYTVTILAGAIADETGNTTTVNYSTKFTTIR